MEPTEQLMKQTAFKVAPIDYNVSVVTMEELYSAGHKFDVLILNEYDQVINSHAYCIIQWQIKGLGHLREKKVFEFSATTNSSYERFANNFIRRPNILKFKSEYEQVHGVNPIVEATVKTAVNTEQLLQIVEKDIADTYEKQPIILVIDEN